MRGIKNPNDAEIFAGLSGGKLEVDSFEIGDGLVLSKTYAHLMAPMLMAFAPAPPGQPHPAPWKAAHEGFSRSHAPAWERNSRDAQPDLRLLRRLR